MEQNDVSDRTIVVLVILAVVVSILGTWMVLSSVGQVDMSPRIVDVSGSESSGEVRMNIVNPNAPTAQVVADAEEGAQIALRIVR